jgi:hypothetical protein
MKLSKSLSKILAGVAVGSALFFGNPKPASADTPLYFYNKLGIEYKMGTPYAGVDSGLTLFPHSPFDSNSNKFYFLGNFSLEDNFGIGFEKDKFNFKIGPNLRLEEDFNANESTLNNTSYNIPSGYGTGEVVFGKESYSALRKKLFPSPGISAEIDYLFENGLDCFFEYSANFFNELFLENGTREVSQSYSNNQWGDSIDYSYTPNTDSLLADIAEHRIRLGITGSQKYMGLFLELYLPQIINLTDLGKEKGLAVSPSISLGTFFQLTNEKGNRK